MPAKNTPKLDNRKKARIIARKLAQTDTHKTIAGIEGVSRETVVRLKLEEASNDVLALIPIEQEKIAKRLEKLQHKALDRIDTALDGENVPLNQLSTTFGILYDKHRLETGQPTSITQESPGDRTEAFIAFCLSQGRTALEVAQVLRTADQLDRQGMTRAARLAAAERLEKGEG